MQVSLDMTTLEFWKFERKGSSLQMSELLFMLVHLIPPPSSLKFSEHSAFIYKTLHWTLFYTCIRGLGLEGLIKSPNSLKLSKESPVKEQY